MWLLNDLEQQLIHYRNVILESQNPVEMWIGACQVYLHYAWPTAHKVLSTWFQIIFQRWTHQCVGETNANSTILLLFFFFLIGSGYVAKAGLELEILLPCHPKCRDDMHAFHPCTSATFSVPSRMAKTPPKPFFFFWMFPKEGMFVAFVLHSGCGDSCEMPWHQESIRKQFFLHG